MRHAFFFLVFTTSALFAQTAAMPDLPAWVTYAGAKIQPSKTEIFKVPKPHVSDGNDIASVPAHWKAMLEPIVPEEIGFPIVRHVTFNRIRVTQGRTAINASSMPESVIEGFRFKDCQFETRSAGRITQARGWQFDGVTITTPNGQATPTLTHCEDMSL